MQGKFSTGANLKKWTTLSSNDETTRWQTLSRAARENGADNEFVPWGGGGVEGLQNLSALEDFAHVRVSSSQALKMMKHLSLQSSWTTLLGMFDGMSRVDGRWWPLCGLYESFDQIIIQLGQGLDIGAGAMIAGAGGAARIAIAALAKRGFKNFLVTNFDRAEAENLMREVRAHFFGLTFKWVPMEGIVLLPAENSVLCNCTPSVEDNALLVELSYLNFLKRPGLLFDLGLGSKPSLLSQEASAAGVSVISGVELAARTDVLWAKWAFQVDLDPVEYRTRLQAALHP
jgi:hypothetical protein